MVACPHCGKEVTVEVELTTGEKKITEADIKDWAYEHDPACWLSYSGKPKTFKQQMEKRRQESMETARKHFGIL